MTVLQTPRLWLRPPTFDDVPTWHAVVWDDPEVSRWLLPPDPVSLERLTQFVSERVLPQWDEQGFGIWLVSDRATHQLAGHCGLLVNEPGRVDLLYALGRAWWGQGLATEAVQAVASWAFESSAVDHLAAFVFPGNDASVRVLDKVGFVPAGTTEVFDTELWRFELS